MSVTGTSAECTVSKIFIWSGTWVTSTTKDQLTFAVFHILGPSIASLDEIAETATFLGDARYFLVKNFINAVVLPTPPLSAPMSMTAGFSMTDSSRNSTSANHPPPVEQNHGGIEANIWNRSEMRSDLKGRGAR
jgi:hypothetical protein